ncbi:SPFH domain-containing protein [Marinifilum sp.]|uniref:SPFH domain-containing protein n=1 Tax=Marinifilum sp. TaxID=2033137 RepID=UPI003BA925B5
MKNIILITFLLLTSIYSWGNKLTIQLNKIRSNTHSFLISMNDQIFYQQVRGDSINSVAKNGVSFHYSFAMRYYTLDNNHIVTLQSDKNDTNEGIHPEVLKIMNGIFEQYSIGEIYSFKRKEVETLILEKLRNRFKKDHIQIEAILFRSIQFSEKLKQKIYERLLKEEEARKANK